MDPQAVSAYRLGGIGRRLAQMTTTRIKVRGYHEDRFGHVNNARYLEFLEEARWAHLEERGLDIPFFKAHGIFPVVVRLSISYRRPASAGDILEVTAEVARVSHRKIMIAQQARIAESGEVCVEAELAVMFLDERTGRPIRLNEEILDAWPELNAACDEPSAGAE
jgi:thioesterase-3